MARHSDENRLTELDSHLITLLQRDACRPNTDIARDLRVGESTVRWRVQSLIRQGYLKIYEFISKRLGKISGIRRCDTATVLRIKKRSFEYGVAATAGASNGQPLHRLPRRARLRSRERAR